MGPLLWLLACREPEGVPDADHDGAPDADDCAPDDPFVYPGAPDAPADGVDADCEGVDPDFPFVGEWSITLLNAEYSSFPVVVPGSAEGLLVVHEDGSATLDATATLDPAIAGLALGLDLAYTGYASSAPGEGGAALYLDGLIDAQFYEETSYVEYFCTTVEGTLRCEGTLKAIETTLLSWAEFEAD